MDAILSIIADIKEKMQKVIEQNNQLVKDNGLIKEKNNQLSGLLVDKEKNILEFQEKLKVLRITKSLKGEEEDNKDVKLKINELVREIDKCITLLND